MSELLYPEESYRIQGAIFEVYREMGCGFSESVYQECLALEMNLRGIPYEREKELPLVYKGTSLSKKFRPDFICYGSIILELKATSDLTATFEAQIHNYLRASRLTLGLLANFGQYPKAIIRRIAFSTSPRRHTPS